MKNIFIILQILIISPSFGAEEKIKLKVNKMMCGGCTSRVKKSIEAHPNVKDVSVSLDTHEATFTCTKESSCNLEQILKDLDRIGFPSKAKEP